MKKNLLALLTLTSVMMELHPVPVLAQPKTEPQTFSVIISRVATVRSADSKSATDFYAVVETRSGNHFKTEVIYDDNEIRPWWYFRWEEPIFYVGDQYGTSVRIRIFDRDPKSRLGKSKNDLLLDETIFIYPMPSNKRTCKFVFSNYGQIFGSYYPDTQPPCFSTFRVVDGSTSVSGILEVY